jgi:hypothetical protein
MSIKTNELYLIQGLKKQKSMVSDMNQLIELIQQHSADFQNETPLLGDEQKQRAQLIAWWQAYRDLERDLEWLNLRIQHTNVSTYVPITFDKVTITMPISSWVYRRQHGCDRLVTLESAFSSRGLKEQSIKTSSGVTEVMKIRYYYDPQLQAQRLMDAKREKSIIDSTLEVVNATTKLLVVPELEVPNE